MRPAGEAFATGERFASRGLLILAVSCAVPLALLSRHASQSAATPTGPADATVGYQHSQTCLEVGSSAYLLKTDARFPVFLGMW